MHKFAIVTNRRSGSNMLVSMLNGHPEIRCFRELMRSTPRWMKKQGYRGALRILEIVDPSFKKDRYRFAHPEKFVDAVFNTVSKEVRTCGFKLHIDQHPIFLKKLLKDPNWKIVILERENKLAQYSSQKISRITGQGSASKNTHVIQAKAKFRKKEFLKFINNETKTWENVYSTLESCSRSYFHIRYTDLVNSKKIIALLDFLGVKSDINLSPKTKKRNPSDIMSRFSNHTEASATLDKLGKNHWIVEELNHQ